MRRKCEQNVRNIELLNKVIYFEHILQTCEILYLIECQKNIFIINHVLPLIAFIVLYGAVSYTFQQRRKSKDLASSRVIDRASADLSKSAVTITIIFILSLSPGFWYYLLGATTIVKYIPSTRIVKVTLWLISINSTANPFVYALLMPAYRRSFKKTFFCKFQ